MTVKPTPPDAVADLRWTERESRWKAFHRAEADRLDQPYIEQRKNWPKDGPLPWLEPVDVLIHRGCTDAVRSFPAFLKEWIGEEAVPADLVRTSRPAVVAWLSRYEAEVISALAWRERECERRFIAPVPMRLAFVATAAFDACKDLVGADRWISAPAEPMTSKEVLGFLELLKRRLMPSAASDGSPLAPTLRRPRRRDKRAQQEAAIILYLLGAESDEDEQTRRWNASPEQIEEETAIVGGLRVPATTVRRIKEKPQTDELRGLLKRIREMHRTGPRPDGKSPAQRRAQAFDSESGDMPRGDD